MKGSPPPLRSLPRLQLVFLILLILFVVWHFVLNHHESSCQTPAHPTSGEDSPDYTQFSYAHHKKEMTIYAKGENEWSASVAKTWMDSSSIDFWRNDRIYDLLKPIVQVYCDKTKKRYSKWLTLGDGRYGTEAHYLLRNGCDATASDIIDDMLAEASKVGFINKYMALNAENTGLPSNSYDFVLVKEAYHHFPRPPLAFYEAFRITKRALILLEPFDQIPESRGHPDKTSYSDYTTIEGAGNFIYGINGHELMKMATSMQADSAAFRGYYTEARIDNLAFEKAEESNPIFQEVIQRTEEFNRNKTYNLFAAVIFKDQRTMCTSAWLLKQDGWNIVVVPKTVQFWEKWGKTCNDFAPED